MTPASPTGPIVRRATSADLPRIGRLGALLIEEHHDFDSRRFLAARQRTPTDYASCAVVFESSLPLAYSAGVGYQVVAKRRSHGAGPIEFRTENAASLYFPAGQAGSP